MAKTRLKKNVMPAPMRSTLSRRLRTLVRLVREGEFGRELMRRRDIRRRSKRVAFWEQHVAQQERVKHRLERGVRMWLYPDDVLSRLIYLEAFEKAERDFVWSYLKPGDVFVDVGANIGLFTLLAAKKVGTAGRVYAFEPSPETYRRLVQNLSLNRFVNVMPHELALSSQNEQRALRAATDGYAAWDSFGVPAAGTDFLIHEVCCVTWDAFVAREQVMGRVALVKMDVEGWEEHALRGGQQTFRRPDAPDLIVEFTDKNAAGAGTTCQQVYRLLVDFGYRLYVIEGDQRALRPDPIRAEYPYVNLLATKRPELGARKAGYRLTAG